MTIKDGLVLSITQFKKLKITSATIDAEVILSFITAKSKEFIYGHPEYKLTAIQEKKLTSAIARRCRLEPVAYITNQKEFYGLNFYVDKNVLVPRPETEILIDEVIKIAGKNQNKLKIADIGTGSGAIAITLKKYLPKSEITATDKSAKALAVAKLNAQKQKIKIKFILGDLTNPIKGKSYDIIVTNLPYLPNSDKELKGLKYEPNLALYGGNNGFELYLKCFKQMNKFKINFKYLICEIDCRYTVKLKKLIKDYFPYHQISLIKDLSGKNRIIKLETK